jgi:hypothetical protein
MPEAQPALRIGGQVYRNPAMAIERRREAAVIPQFLNEVVADNDLMLGYCRNPFTPDIMAQEHPSVSNLPKNWML